MFCLFLIQRDPFYAVSKARNGAVAAHLNRITVFAKGKKYY